jgi:competence protein ComEA
MPAARPQLTAHPVADPVSSEGRGSPVAGTSPVTEVVVHVAGKVRRPGVVTLTASSRVNDAVVAAGGALPGTDLSSVDLARHVVDGEQILVGVPGTAAAMSSAPPAAAPGAGSGERQPAVGSGSSEVLNLNTAGPEQLDSLPGVGPVLAQRIIAWRAEHGGSRSVEELREVKGLGGKKFDDIAPLVRV